MSDTHEELKRFIAERYFFDAGAELAPSTALFSTRAIDSFGVMELLLKIEALYGVQLDIPMLTDNKVDTVQDLLRVIHLRRGAA